MRSPLRRSGGGMDGSWSKVRQPSASPWQTPGHRETGCRESDFRARPEIVSFF